MRAAPPVRLRRLGRCIRLIWFGVALLSAASAEVLTVATYNVENYGVADRMTKQGYRKAYPKPEAEKVALRHVIRALNADVLVLQEMGPTPFLNELRRDLRRDGCSYPYLAFADAEDAERHVAILSRRPLYDVTTLSRLEFSYFGRTEHVKRGLLLVTVKTDAGRVTLCGLHLKSKLTERPDDPGSAIRRVGEATAIRDAVLRKFPNPAAARFVVLGDCNDARNSKAVERLEHRGREEIGVLLPAIDSRRESWTYTYRHDRTHSELDHVLVSPKLLSAVIGGAAHIYDGPAVPDASDHRPVVVTLRLDQAL